MKETKPENKPENTQGTMISTEELAKRLGKAGTTVLRRAEKLGIKPIDSSGKPGRPSYFFTPEQAEAIENFGKQKGSNADTDYVPDDLEQAQEGGYLTLADHQNALVATARQFAMQLRQEEQQLAATLAKYASPEARLARVLGDMGGFLAQGTRTLDLSDLYLPVTPLAVLPDGDRKRRLMECL